MPVFKHHSGITLIQLLFTVIVLVAIILLKCINFNWNFYHIFICPVIHLFHLKKMPHFSYVIDNRMFTPLDL